MTFSEQIVNAMFKPSKYKELVELKKGRFALFALVISLVLGIINYAIPTGAFVASFGGFDELFGRKIGNIKYEDGKLTDDSKYELSFQGTRFIINTDEERVPDEKLKKDGIYITFGAKYAQMATVVDGTVYVYQSFSYDGLIPEGFDNEALCELVPTMYVYLVMMFAASCIGYYIKYAVFALILALICNGINKRLELGMSFKQMFRLCFYGQTLGIIISNFNSALGLLPVLLVSMVTIFVSIRMITSSLALIAKDKQL